ncbi:MAG: hypothetical protein A2528_01625 [Candidatus Staskawiczbacteria bacterium RIFOXYD2_FULL_37_9]|uniref:Capsule synthesis protein CapA domain-containing protein n=1 Tax=Candidatus Staskawiczbacteria bacterium RIFOXYB1_FULL_37_44 TaxID=1802223 RepID=A0A1G2IW07_9BACT|nr:MAG: hypothetical protein A2358_03065 [Candidatus Staskawiczbacteria bacterium RIFOXYB1_FULL_37_44]OGZ83587.1 MAG: hypothetical protein A2416_04530 [Candidatus Staskawiczbacteria bacterium RIFOXYC1_FULL_37_52]OGZ88686.1 MAG: hypothetical protein A2581_02785 [Candidatus Staskawiczbacteria bacterium RIFOXYD1_FULL_37_110]OGZ89027.1 MAG: hypothetical protein A2444_00125 [Candidatus Staskawiczbacteria bacterium RIFOXYC2_FULL_37_19]OGZ92999.1 MAG: hypothetical protein A2528_01625 [Candidatus Stask
MPKNKENIIKIILIAVAVISATVYLFLPENLSSPNNKFPQQKSFARILFVGDLMLDRGIRYYANKNGGNNFIFEKIFLTLSENDLVVANLEGPITDNKSISSGTAPGSANNYFFTFDPGVAKTLFENNIKLVSLGNNHILNFGRGGLAQTKNYLDKANVDYFGAADYPKTISAEINGIKITFINYNEFSEIGELEQKETIEEIEKAKTYSDIIVIYCHWGVEYALTASDSQKNLAHNFINAGADLVIGSHPHVIEPMEIYNGKKIYYSLGNFIFDQYFSEAVRNGLGVAVKINKNTKQLDFSEKYFYLDSNGQTVEK